MIFMSIHEKWRVFKMNVKVKKLSFEQSVIEVETRSGIKELIINKTGVGHAYEDFAEWDITDNQYYDLEDLVDDVIKRMDSGTSLNVIWE